MNRWSDRRRGMDPWEKRASRMLSLRESRELERAADALLVEAGVATARETRRHAARVDRAVRLSARAIMAERAEVERQKRLDRRRGEHAAEASAIAERCRTGEGLSPRESDRAVFSIQPHE